MYRLLFAFACCLIICSCSVGNSRAGDLKDEYKMEREIQDLTLELKRVSGIRVTGLGAKATILIKGRSTFAGNDEPIFIVDDAPFNGSYEDLYTTLNPRDIKNIMVLKGADLAMYGAYAANGVIKIDLK